MTARAGQANGAVRVIGGQRVYVCADAGSCLAQDKNASDLVGDLFSSDVRLVAIPLERLGPEFLRLASGVAGAILQKLVNYRFRIAVVGDISTAVAASAPLRDFVRESNRGQTVWFVEDLATLESKLG